MKCIVDRKITVNIKVFLSIYYCTLPYTKDNINTHISEYLDGHYCDCETSFHRHLIPKCFHTGHVSQCFHTGLLPGNQLLLVESFQGRKMLALDSDYPPAGWPGCLDHLPNLNNYIYIML